MLKKMMSASVIMLALTLFTSSQSPISAQGTAPILETPECVQIAWSCAQVTDLNPGAAGKPHTQHLQQTGLPATDINGNPQQFVVACGINTDRGFLATTGNSTLDKKYCLSSGEFDTLNYLKTKYQYSLKLEGFSNPFLSNGGNIDVKVTPANVGANRTHMCVIGWELPVTTTGSTQGDASNNPATADTYGLDYTTFTFPIGAAQCTTVYADPYGRTYNKDLKPVPGVDVRIFDFDSKELINLIGIVNPVRTAIDGLFNFNIPPGRSYLDGNVPTLTEVHPNYSLAYTDPYTYGDLIVEKLGKAEQRDIAVNGGGTPVLELTGYSHVKTGDHILVQGSASWPLTMVDLMQGNTSIVQQQATKFGNFEFRLDPAKIDPTQQITIKLTEVDLTVNPQAPAANPATDEISIDPIASYLEGYAYDENGNLMPFATVRIRMKNTDAIYYTTKADDSAFYSVEPRNLPILPFYVEIIPANNVPVVTGTGGTEITGTPNPSPLVSGTPSDSTPGPSVQGTVVSIPEYARQNKEYHDVNVVDIMVGTKNGTKVDPVAVADTASAVFGGTEGSTETDQENSDAVPSAQETQQRYLTLLILVVLLLFVGTGAVLLVRKKGRHDVFADSSNAGGNVYTREDSVENPTGE